MKELDSLSSNNMLITAYSTSVSEPEKKFLRDGKVIIVSLQVSWQQFLFFYAALLSDSLVSDPYSVRRLMAVCCSAQKSEEKG